MSVIRCQMLLVRSRLPGVRCQNFTCPMFDIWCPMFQVRCPMSDLWCATIDVQCTMSDVRPLMCDVRSKNSDVWCSMTILHVWSLMFDVKLYMSDVRCLMSDFQFLMSDVWCPMPDVRSLMWDDRCARYDMRCALWDLWCAMSDVKIQLWSFECLTFGLYHCVLHSWIVWQCDCVFVMCLTLWLCAYVTVSQYKKDYVSICRVTVWHWVCVCVYVCVWPCLSVNSVTVWQSDLVSNCQWVRAWQCFSLIEWLSETVSDCVSLIQYGSVCVCLQFEFDSPVARSQTRPYSHKAANCQTPRGVWLCTFAHTVRVAHSQTHSYSHTAAHIHPSPAHISTPICFAPALNSQIASTNC